MAPRAEEKEITVVPIGGFCLDPIELNALVLGFSGIRPGEIRAGVETLAGVLEAMARNRRSM